ncbi:MAG: asparagine synthase C-terminal domain-containing protein [Gemmatales bacterium]
MDPVTRMQYVDLFTWLRGDILVKADKMTMANSLELRVPFLDKEVFAVAEGLPYDQKISHGTTKYALRKALEQIVPPHVLHRTQARLPGAAAALAGRTRDVRLGARHHQPSRSTDDLIDKKFVLQMLDEHRAGQVDNSRRIWNVLVLHDLVRDLRRRHHRAADRGP